MAGVVGVELSSNQKKAYRKADRYGIYEANVRQDYNHKTSHALALSSPWGQLVAYTALIFKGQTRRHHGVRHS